MDSGRNRIQSSGPEPLPLFYSNGNKIRTAETAAMNNYWVMVWRKHFTTAIPFIFYNDLKKKDVVIILTLKTITLKLREVVNLPKILT